MRGISYLIDDTGKRKAVMIDLSDWGKFWEDFHDVLVSATRSDEPTIPWETLKAEIEQDAAQPA
ncbi:MAG: hypothetical protein Q7T82_18485 [Armatimonadota bacterium]|nr:hypothetical protein [Armatimonadota bacterium]